MPLGFPSKNFYPPFKVMVIWNFIMLLTTAFGQSMHLHRSISATGNCKKPLMMACAGYILHLF